MAELGNLKRIKDLRSVWPNEARDFSAWLSEDENLSLLGKELGIDISLEERESSVGDFNVDIFASEENSQRKIVIENQLEDTNHDHLGKIITYASGKNAEVVIWIAKRAREEHRQAIEWLNQHTDENVDLFLVEVELWKIDDSAIAPKFNVVERPNNWAKSNKKSDTLTKTKKEQLEFWQEFAEFASSYDGFLEQFSIRRPKPHHWFDLSVGNSACHLSLNVNTQKKTIDAGIYIGDDKILYNMFKGNMDRITDILGERPIFKEAAKASRILLQHKANIEKREDWEEYFEWLCDTAIKFRKIVREIA